MDPFTTPHDEVLLAGVKPEHETQEEMIIRLLKPVSYTHLTLPTNREV